MRDAVYDVVIVGGGIVGAACAVEFARSGLRVAVIESSVVGGGATAAGMGHIALMDDSEAQFQLCRYSQLLWMELARQLPPQAEYVSCGAIWIAAEEEEMTEVRRKQQFYQERGAPVQVLDRRSLCEAEPNLRPGLLGGLLVEEDAVLYPPCAATFLMNEAVRLGARLLLGNRVIALAKGSATLAHGAVLSSPAFVLANGADACSLVPSLPIQPRKGHLLITDRYPGFVKHQVIELGYLKNAHALESDSVAFNVQPRPTGQVLIGSSRQYGRADSQIDARILSSMLSRAVNFMPQLHGLSAIRGWTGLRAATPDKLPLIGLCPGYDGVYLATGHEGLGITTSLATAALLADIVLGRTSAIDRSPYSPERIVCNPHLN